MMVLWEQKNLRVKDLGGRLYLDSSTLTPLLKSLEDKGYVTRRRSIEDQRDLIITITEQGEALKEKAAAVPGKLLACVEMESRKAKDLRNLLYELIDKLTQ